MYWPLSYPSWSLKKTILNDLGPESHMAVLIPDQNIKLEENLRNNMDGTLKMYIDIITWILHQIIICSNQVKPVAG